MIIKLIALLMIIEFITIRLCWKIEFICDYTYVAPWGTYQHNSVKFIGILEIHKHFKQYKNGIKNFKIIKANF